MPATESSEASAPPIVVEPIAPTRSPADRRMRRLLRLPPDGAPVSIFSANNALSSSIAISAIRCLFTYIAIPFLLPLVNLSGRVGPVIGILLSLASVTAIVIATRRFFGADHKWRWGYAIFGGTVLVWLVVQTGFDLADLFSR